VVEGYYGRPWTHEARRDVVRFLGRQRLNTFVYGPKNDPWHRDRWREPYPAAEVAALGETARVARRARVRFVWAISPVHDVCYACPQDFDALGAKLTQLANAGIRRFALFFDDGGALTAPEDVARYGGTDATALARAQADLANRTHRWLRRHGLAGRPLVVPSDYYGTVCRPYHTELARALVRGLPVAWTGPAVLSRRITADAARARRECLPGHPVVLWDNYPVNDVVLSNTLHLGPLDGRDPDLPPELAGYLANPMTQPHASLIPLATIAAYLRKPRAYAADAAWAAALDRVATPGVGRLAHQVRSSFIDPDDARELAFAVDAVAAAAMSPGWEPPLARLEVEARDDAAAAAAIATAAPTDPLAAEVLPWAGELAAHAARTGQAVTLLRALKPGLAVSAEPAGDGMLRVRGSASPPDTATATALGPGFVTDADAVEARTAAPPLAAYVACLGPILSADVRSCPEFGLNVHGKSLYVAFTDRLEVITDRSIHDRLLRLMRGLYQEWSARQDAAPAALTVLIEGVDGPLAAGGFDVVVPAPAGRVRVTVTTDAGDATSRIVP
jgi:hyaluronoglucosaminidase